MVPIQRAVLSCRFDFSLFLARLQIYKIFQPWALGAVSNLLSHSRVGIREYAVDYNALKLLMLVCQYPLAPTRFLACLCIAKLAEESGIPQLLCGLESEKYPSIQPIPDAVEILVDISEDSEPFFVDKSLSGLRKNAAVTGHSDQDTFLAQIQAARVLALIADCSECHFWLYSRGAIGPIISLLCCDCPALQAIGATGLGHLAEEFVFFHCHCSIFLSDSYLGACLHRFFLRWLN
jgi:hypothetical protein